MKKDPGNRQQQSQSPQERPQSPQPNFEPEQAEPDIRQEDIAQRAYAIYQQRGGFPGAELDDWLQAEQELRNSHKAA
jgi:hypothetical protein